MKTAIHSSLGPPQRVQVPPGFTVTQQVEYLGLGGVELCAMIRNGPGAGTEWSDLPPELWQRVRPKSGDVICYAYLPGKNPLKSALVIAALAATVAAPFMAPLTGALLTGGLLAANVAVNRLFPDELPSNANPELEAVRRLSDVQSDSNPAAKGGYLPIVAGLRRISPPELSDPRYSLDDSRQVVERLFAFDGHHALSGIQVDGAPVADYAAITAETVPGAGDSPTSTFANKCSKFAALNMRLSGFDLDETALVNQTDPAKSQPAFTRFTTAGHVDLDEITIRLQLDGFVKSDDPAADIRLPLRLRFREKASTGAWRNLPEIHITGHDQSSLLKEFRIRWDGAFGAENEPGSFNYGFFQRVPPAAETLVDAVGGDQWQADPHFTSGADLADVVNITGGRQGVRITLGDGFARVEYEFELMRGLALEESALDVDYEQGGKVPSLFAGFLSDDQTWNVPIDQAAYSAAVSVRHAQIIVNQQPCQRPATALLALKSIDETIQNVTVLAARYVRDWDGEGWNTLTADCRNPATHARQILADALARFGVSESLIDNDAFVAWRQVCATQGYEVSAVFSGTSLGEALQTIVSAGFARLSFSDIFTVDWLRDRSAELPKASFSPNNSTITIETTEPELPLAIRVKFNNKDDDYKDDETVVNNPFLTTISGQAVREYRGIAKRALVRKRAFFELLQDFFQGRRRARVSASNQAAFCEVGNLVQLVTDLVDDDAFGAVVTKVIDGTTIEIDQAPGIESTTSFFDDENVFDGLDIFAEGELSLALISGPAGTQELPVVSAALGERGRITVRFGAVLTSQDIAGAHIVIGPKSKLAQRWIVLGVDRQAEERAVLTLVPEAPEIYEHLKRFDA